MASVTTWIRLEPSCRLDSLAPGLEARIHDGLWFLARQWQFGEYAAQDAGSPIAVRIRGETADLETAASSFAVEVEAATIDAAGSRMRDRVEAGRHLLRMLAIRGLLGARRVMLARYPLAAGDGALGLASAGRVVDGSSAHTELAPLLAGGGELPTTFGLDPSELQPTTEVVRAWLAWCDAQFVVPARPAWDPRRLEYAFSTKIELSDRDVVLGAREYDGMGLDWYSFDVLEQTQASRTARELVRTVYPATASYRGMPARRYWELEDSAVDFGAIDAPPGDITRLLLADFGLVYGGDWRLAPLELASGSVCRIASVVVTDTFGVRTLVPSALADPRTASFRLFGTTGAEDLLFVASRARVLESPPVEEVHLLRDEGANLVWGIERRIEGSDGTAVDLTQLPATPPPSSDVLAYRVARRPRDNWIPLKPADAEGLVLQPAAFARAGGGAPFAALGEILRAPEIADEEVPREGIRVSRVYRFARWFGGRSLLWIAHRKQPGGDPIESGLRFDVLEGG